MSLIHYRPVLSKRASTSHSWCTFSGNRGYHSEDKTTTDIPRVNCLRCLESLRDHLNAKF